MRPLERSKNNRKYSDYKQYYPDLIQAFGMYCSYCECQLGSGSVEHVSPRSYNSEKTCEWENLLLACSSCNSTKKDIIKERSECVWPDEDNTYDLIRYDDTTCQPYPKENVCDMQRKRIGKLISALKLDEGCNEVFPQKAAHVRSILRKSVYEKAKRHKVIYLAKSGKEREDYGGAVLDCVRFGGFWSMWMKVFEDIPDMKEKLLNLIPGTNKSYWY